MRRNYSYVKHNVMLIALARGQINQNLSAGELKISGEKMRKYRKLFLNIFLSIMVLMFSGCGKEVAEQVESEISAQNEVIIENEEDLPESNPTDSEKGEVFEEEEKEVGVEFPVILEDGKLEIESVFWFDGINPDCNNQEGSNVATITVNNLSDTYLDSANITITTNAGELLRFVIEELPAGKSMIAFAVDNTSIDTEIICDDVSCETVFDSEASMNADKISVSVDGTIVTLQNNTATEIKNIVVYCHSILEDQFFGGVTYSYNVNSLPANGTIEFDAVDCFLGFAEVVRIVVDER